MKKTALALFILILSFTGRTADYYWNPDIMAGNIDWSNLNNWFTTSGGSVNHTSLPGPADDVYWDSNTLLPAMTIDIPAQCHHFIVTGSFSLPPEMNAMTLCPLEIFGSFSVPSDMTMACHLVFTSTSAGNTINANNYLATNDPFDVVTVEFNGIGGEWTLLDDFRVSWITFTSGSLITQNNNITTKVIDFDGNNNKSVDFGTSTITLIDDAGFQANANNLTLDADEAVFYLRSGPNPIAIEFIGGTGHTYHRVVFDTAAPIAGLGGVNCLIHELEVRCPLYGHSYNGTINHALFLAGGELGGDAEVMYDTLVLDNTISPAFQGLEYYSHRDSILVSSLFQVNSGAGDTIVIDNSMTGNETIHLYNDTICIDYVKLTNSAASGNGMYYAGANSVDLGNNTNWIFNACNWLGITENESRHFSVYPNPATETVTLVSSMIETGNVIQVFDVYGRNILSENATSTGSVSLNITGLKNGTYYVSINGVVSSSVKMMVCR